MRCPLQRGLSCFVQRHPRKIVIPVSTDPRYKLLLCSRLGQFPEDGLLKDVEGFYLGALDGKREELQPASFPDLFKTDVVFPLRVTVQN